MIAEARGYKGDPLLAVILAVGRFDVAVAVVAVAAPLYAFWLIARICVVGSAWGERVAPETAVARPDPAPLDTEALAVRERGNCIDTMRVTR